MGLESGGLESECLEARATDFGSGYPHACVWGSRVWASRVWGSRGWGLESRATDFGSGSIHSGGLLSRLGV